MSRTKLSRGIRNNNPGNIRLTASPFQGEINPSQDREFKQFKGAEWGYRAIFLIIHNYAVLYGIDTLDKIIKRWAPPVENDTSIYIEVVAKRMNLYRTSHIDSLNRDTMLKLVTAMVKIECGVEPERDKMERGWELFAEGRDVTN
ncbi:MAG: structural protein P5 [Rikenellaceae bacterium]